MENQGVEQGYADEAEDPLRDWTRESELGVDGSSECLVPIPTVQDLDEANTAVVPSNGTGDCAARSASSASTSISIVSEQSESTFSSLVNRHCRELVVGARQCMAACMWQSAIVKLSRAILLASKSSELYLLRGEAFLQMADFKSATMNFEKALFCEPANSELRQRLTLVLYLHGRSLFELTLYEEALALFDRVIEDEFCPMEVHGSRISCLALLDRHKECLDYVDHLLEKYDDNADFLIVRARLYKGCGRNSACFYDIQAALDLDSEHAAAHQLLEDLQQRAYGFHSQAVKLCLGHHYSEALQKISLAIEADPSAATYHVFRGILHRRMRNFTAAVDDFTIALAKCGLDEKCQVSCDAHRHLSLTYNELAVECFMNQFYNEAVLLLNKAIGREKNDPGMYINRGDCFFKMADLEFALADYEQALDLSPEDWTLRGRLAVVNCRLGAREYAQQCYDRSLEYFNSAISVQPAIATAYAQRARVHFLKKDLGKCQEDVLSALALNSQEETALSLASRLFPDTTPREIMTMEIGMAARERVRTAIRQCHMDAHVKVHHQPVTEAKVQDHVDEIIAAMPKLFLAEDGVVPKRKAGKAEATKAQRSLKQSGSPVAGGLQRIRPMDLRSVLSSVSAASASTGESDSSSTKDPVSNSRSKQLRRPNTELSSKIEIGGLPGVPEPAMPSLQACLADREFFTTMVKAKNETDTKFSKLLRAKRPSLAQQHPARKGKQLAKVSKS
eukprot:scpid48454/ scgid5413/ Tetratricopeptide repeat protein 16